MVDIEIFLYVSNIPRLPSLPNHISIDIPGWFVIRQPADYTKQGEVADVPPGGGVLQRSGDLVHTPGPSGQVV